MAVEHTVRGDAPCLPEKLAGKTKIGDVELGIADACVNIPLRHETPSSMKPCGQELDGGELSG